MSRVLSLNQCQFEKAEGVINREGLATYGYYSFFCDSKLCLLNMFNLQVSDVLPLLKFNWVPQVSCLVDTLLGGEYLQEKEINLVVYR